MARARNIKPGFFQNEDLVELDFATRLLFIGLWTEADRAGRLEDRPKRLKMALFPADNLDVDAMLDALEGFGFIRRYVVGEQRLIQVVSWAKHQNPHHTEKGSVLPAEHSEAATDAEPFDNGESTVNALEQDGGNPADSLIPDSKPSPNTAREASDDLTGAMSVTAGPFPMSLEWEPDQNKLSTLALCAGLPLAAFSREAVGGFKVHHEASSLAKTDKQWLASLVNWVKRDHVRDARVVSFPGGGQRRANGPDFDDLSWAQDLGEL
ncbi:hypothetical protein D3C78_474230 [compost metagenome]